MTIRRTTNSGSTRLAKAASGPDFGDPKAISGLLEAWFPGAARILPWRERRTGYGALVSELMLQQTQVSRVVDAFARFMARFPSVVGRGERFFCAATYCHNSPQGHMRAHFMPFSS